jgi:hypothetical protein
LAPTICFTGSPPENTIKVGIDMTLYSRAAWGLASMSIFTILISLCSEAISSSTGATILHGPHQVAQKSTSTGLSLPSTSSANDLSVTITVDLSAMSSPVCGYLLTI